MKHEANYSLLCFRLICHIGASRKRTRPSVPVDFLLQKITSGMVGEYDIYHSSHTNNLLWYFVGVWLKINMTKHFLEWPQNTGLRNFDTELHCLNRSMMSLKLMTLFIFCSETSLYGIRIEKMIEKEWTSSILSEHL